MILLLWNIQKRQIIESESRLVVAGAWGKEKMGSDCLMSLGFLRVMKKFCHLDCGDGCTTVWVYLICWIVHFNMVEMVNSMLCVFFFALLLLLLLLFCFSGPQVQHMEIPRLGVESELYLLAYATATAMLGLSSICDLHRSSWQQCWIP